MSTFVAIGKKIPSFEVKDSRGNLISSQSLLGHPFVLYFYPKDDTPGCTTEACELRDIRDQFNGLNAAIVGVSPDSDSSHNKFIEKHHLNFPLVSDPDHTLSSLFGAWGEKKSFGKTSQGIIRSTFIVDNKGILRAIEQPVAVKGHADRVLKALHDLLS